MIREGFPMVGIFNLRLEWREGDTPATGRPREDRISGRGQSKHNGFKIRSGKRARVGE